MTLRLPRRVALALPFAAWLTPRAARAAESPIGVFPVAFAVAEKGGSPVRDGAWLDAELARAEALFAPHGVSFRRASRRPLAEAHADMVTRDDRDALRAFLLPGVINVFVVASLKDVDEENRFRFGVHWRATHAPDRRYVILSAAAPATVLAHELGHYFGNPHSATPDNVMSYTRTGKDVFFDDAQVLVIRRTARQILRAREVLPLPLGDG